MIEGRDAEFHRFIGEGSPDPQPTAVVLDAEGELVGWIDYEVDCAWLTDGEVNVGYCVFPEHRGVGIAGRSLELMVAFLRRTRRSRQQHSSSIQRTRRPSLSRDDLASSSTKTSMVSTSSNELSWMRSLGIPRSGGRSWW